MAYHLCQEKNIFFFILYDSLVSGLISMRDTTMGVIILFGVLIGLFAALLVEHQIRYAKYPISDEYWIAGLLLIGFIASLMTMILV